MSELDWQAAEWVSYNEAARRVGLTAPRIRRMVGLGEIRVLRLGNRPMVSLADVRKLMESRLVPATAATTSSGEGGA